MYVYRNFATFLTRTQASVLSFGNTLYNNEKKKITDDIEPKYHFHL